MSDNQENQKEIYCALCENSADLYTPIRLPKLIQEKFSIFVIRECSHLHWAVITEEEYLLLKLKCKTGMVGNYLSNPYKNIIPRDARNNAEFFVNLLSLRS